MICLSIAIFAQKNNENATRSGNKVQTKLCECFSDFLGLTKFLRLEETVD